MKNADPVTREERRPVAVKTDFVVGLPKTPASGGAIEGVVILVLLRLGLVLLLDASLERRAEQEVQDLRKMVREEREERHRHADSDVRQVVDDGGEHGWFGGGLAQ